MNSAKESMLLQSIPKEVQVSILIYLRAFDLASIQQTCRYFNSPELITYIIQHTATQVYPSELTDGFDHLVRGNPAPKDSHGNFTNFEPMRNLETLVVARVLSRPEPPLHEHSHGFYVSKAWCKSALQWLESQKQNDPDTPSKKKGKKEKKKARIRSRRFSDVSPPWPNVNHDLTCEHGDLRHCSSKSARARRRVMDKQAWKVLKKLYPDSVQLNALQTECLQCALDAETTKKTAEAKKEADKLERMKPLSSPLVRAIYTRANKGVPQNALVPDVKISATGNREEFCPLKPGVYNAIPRAWCHRWRKYLKTGGERPNAPDHSLLLCDAHKLPLVPNHLEAFLYGETPSLLTAMGNNGNMEHADEEGHGLRPPVGMARASSAATTLNNTVDRSMMFAAGVASNHFDVELEAQRLALLSFQGQHQHRQVHTLQTLQTSERNHRANGENSVSNADSRNNDLLDKENLVVVEILTEEECDALEEWWPDIHSSFVMKFAVVNEQFEGRIRTNITWSTIPCRECDAVYSGTNVVVRNRNRKWIKKTKK